MRHLLCQPAQGRPGLRRRGTLCHQVSRHLAKRLRIRKVRESSSRKSTATMWLSDLQSASGAQRPVISKERPVLEACIAPHAKTPWPIRGAERIG